MKLMFKKPGNKLLIYFGSIVICLIVFLIGFTIVKANTPDNPANPAANTNIGVCIDPPYPDISNPRQPIFSWTTSGNAQTRYWLQVDNSPPIVEPAVYQYQRRIDVAGWQYPRCPCDTNQNTIDCPVSFSATAADPSVCYDQWTIWILGRSYTYNKILVTPERIVFPSPEINRNVASGAKSYQTPQDLLPRKTTYWYRIAVRDSYDWTGWTGCQSFYLPGVPPNPPTNLNVSQPADYCGYSTPVAFFSWTFTDPDPGDSQSAYQVQVDNNSNFPSPEDDSGKVSSGSNSYATPLGKLSYNTTYYWRVRVWDTDNLVSPWASGPSFTTPKHAYPTIDFSWAPEKPNAGELVQFTDQSTVFGGATKVSWSWTFQDGNPSSSSNQNATTTFTSAGQKTVTLRVTDSDGFSCQGQKTVNAQMPLPEWKEIPPFMWLRKLLASIGDAFSNNILFSFIK